MMWGCAGIILIVAALLFGIPWLVELVWNWLMLSVNHANWQLGYLQVFAIIFLVSVIAALFKSNEK